MDLVDCPVDIRHGVNKFGIFTNAFRIVPETGEECFLDFCVFSASENRAEVVARLRVHRSFIPVLRERLQEGLEDLTSYGFREGMLLRNGRLVLCRETEE